MLAIDHHSPGSVGALGCPPRNARRRRTVVAGSRDVSTAPLTPSCCIATARSPPRHADLRGGSSECCTRQDQWLRLLHRPERASWLPDWLWQAQRFGWTFQFERGRQSERYVQTRKIIVLRRTCFRHPQYFKFYLFTDKLQFRKTSNLILLGMCTSFYMSVTW